MKYLFVRLLLHGMKISTLLHKLYVYFKSVFKNTDL